MAENCIFCKIIKKEIRSQIVYEDEDTIAFHDINPQAPVHILVIPKKHIPSLAEVHENDKDILGKLLLTASKVAKKLAISEDGYRVVVNTNRDAQQTVFHIHVHVIGGRPMSWPPG
ncbi:MAG: histidine triad nucleotide-binding protein [Leptospiraceae bacterium]|nr:MAG: histidine triad nucleotide-binding protein [Leptospiraceae bacterium]